MREGGHRYLPRVMQYQDRRPHGDVAHQHVRFPLSQQRLEIVDLCRQRVYQKLFPSASYLREIAFLNQLIHGTADYVPGDIPKRREPESFAFDGLLCICGGVEHHFMATLFQCVGHGHKGVQMGRKGPDRQQDTRHGVIATCKPRLSRTRTPCSGWIRNRRLGTAPPSVGYPRVSAGKDRDKGSSRWISLCASASAETSGG